MTNKRNNVNKQLFVTVLSAWLGLMIVGASSQANAKTLIRVEIVKAHHTPFATDFYKGISLSESHEVGAGKRLPLQLLISTFQNFINDFALKVGRSQTPTDLAFGFYSSPNAQTFEPELTTSSTQYSSPLISTSNNHVLVVTNFPRASL